MKLLLDGSCPPRYASTNSQGANCACAACPEIHPSSSRNNMNGNSSPKMPPSPLDILCERDKRYCQHYGNTVFRGVISTYQELYSKAPTKDDKMRITKEIVHVLRTTYNSRFIKLNSKGEWEEIGDRHARDKVSHALRFASRPQRRQGRPTDALPKQQSSPQTTVNSLFCGTNLTPATVEALSAPASPFIKSIASLESSSSSQSSASKRLRKVAHAALDRAASLVCTQQQSSAPLVRQPSATDSLLSEFGENSVGTHDDMQQFLFRHWDVEKEDLSSGVQEEPALAPQPPSAGRPVGDVSFFPLLDHELDAFDDLIEPMGRVGGGVAARVSSKESSGGGTGVLHDELRALANMLQEPSMLDDDNFFMM